MRNLKKNVRFKLAFKLVFVCATLLALGSCTISYKFNGSLIDYTKLKTISIADFLNTAELVHPPLAQEFAESLRDAYTRQTRLRVLKKGGDLHLEGEIVGYQLMAMGVSANTYSTETKLTLTINVRFSNNKNPQEDFEKKYTAFQTFDSTKLLTEVQDELLKTMIADIVDNIYNDTLAKW